MERALTGKEYLQECLKASILGTLFFLVYINDTDENIPSDDTSLFSVVESSIRTANDLNRDLERVRLWA